MLTHEVGPRVSPERARGFERMAAGGLLLARSYGAMHRGDDLADGRFH